MKADPLDIYNDEQIRAEVAAAISEHAKVELDYAEGLADALIEHGILNHHAQFLTAPKTERRFFGSGTPLTN